MTNFDLSPTDRKAFVEHAVRSLEEIYANAKGRPVAPSLTPQEVKDYVKGISLEGSEDYKETISQVIQGLEKFAVHTHHPGYFGLFNPRPNAMSVIGDYITAVMNPQMASWSHAPFANEVERYIIDEFGKRFGFEEADGVFCGGGAESNLTAVQCALNFHFPIVSSKGVLAIDKRPMIYCSSESHHSIVKAARTIGIGSDSVKSIGVAQNLRIDLAQLESEIIKDKERGYKPFLVVATAGTTGSGAIDDIAEIADLAEEYDLWLHVDGAYGAAVIVSDRHKSLLHGIDRADSVTMDFHKWFSVPMGGSSFITRDPKILFRTYNIQTDYMPPDGDQTIMVDPYLHSIQWSRRFIGLKFYLSLVTFGWSGYEDMIDMDIAKSHQLRQMLTDSGWVIKNASDITIINFSHPVLESNHSRVRSLVDKVVDAGRSWVSVYPIHGEPTIRACLSNYATEEEDMRALVDGLNEGILELKRNA